MSDNEHADGYESGEDTYEMIRRHQRILAALDENEALEASLPYRHLSIVGECLPDERGVK